MRFACCSVLSVLSVLLLPRLHMARHRNAEDAVELVDGILCSSAHVMESVVVQHRFVETQLEALELVANKLEVIDDTRRK